jgi:hypothetical protein
MNSRATRASAAIPTAFNLFLWLDGPELACAVPLDLPLPGFLDRNWALARVVCTGQEGSAEFDAEAADLGVRMNGFYLYYRAREQRPARACAGAAPAEA